jgi:Flp pilus assembly pilin Flp
MQQLRQSNIEHFLRDQSGAVTVDWVVLTGAIVGLGIASVTAVRGGVGALGVNVQNSLSGATVAAILLPRPGLLQQNHVDHRLNVYPNTATATLTNWHTQRVADFERALADGHNGIGTNLNNFGAGQYLDIMYLQREELLKRGAYPVPGLMTYEAAHALYSQTF